MSNFPMSAAREQERMDDAEISKKMGLKIPLAFLSPDEREKTLNAVRPGARADDLRIDDQEDLFKQIDYVIANPHIGGFDCSISKEAAKDPEQKELALSYAMRGYIIKITAVEAPDGRYHWRVLITPPKKLTGFPSAGKEQQK